MIQALKEALPEFDVRRVTDADLDALFALEASNEAYNQMYMGRPMTMADCAKELTDVPEGFDPAGKHFLGFWRDGQLCAAMDLLAGYPQVGTCFVGLLMVHGDLQGQGVGRRVMEGLLRAAKGRMTTLRLAVLEENEAARVFWTRLGFEEVRRAPYRVEGVPEHTVLIMERAV